MRSLLALVPYFRKHRRPLLFGLLYVTLSNCFTVVTPMIVGRGIDALKTGVAADTLLLFGGGVVISTAIGGFFSFLTRQTIIVASREIEYDMRNDFLAHLQGLGSRFFWTTSTGDVIAYSTNDIAAVRNLVGPSIMYSADTITTFAFALGLMLSMDPGLTLLALSPLPLVSLGVYFIGRKVHVLFGDVQGQFATMTTRAQEAIAGVRVIRSYVREAFEESQFRRLSREYFDKNLRLAKVQGLMQPAMFLLVGLSVIIVIGIGGAKVARGAMSLGSMVQFVLYLGILIWPMIAFGWVANMVQRAAASMARLNTFLSERSEIIESPNAVTAAAAMEALRGSIAFEHVSFRHPSRTVDALHEIDVEIPAGGTVGILGTTGSGKSTLVSMLSRMIDPTAGRIAIGGVDVRALPLDALRRAIGIVPQEPCLFSDTLRNNIAFARPDLPQEAVERAARMAGVHDDVAGFPRGYDTMLGERGITLSGGQRQRVAIARALAAEPSILILDDALSSVDTSTEERILSELRAFMQGRTSVMIAHRISTVRHADLILVMDRGAVVDRGTHDELLSRPGLYYEIYQKQMIEEELERM